jgi:hypothetical protein
LKGHVKLAYPSDRLIRDPFQKFQHKFTMISTILAAARRFFQTLLCSLDSTNGQEHDTQKNVQYKLIDMPCSQVKTGQMVDEISLTTG